MIHGNAPPSSRSSAATWRHVTADLAGVDAAAFTHASHVEAKLVAGLGDVAAGISWTWHRFDPTGVSVVGLGPRVRVALHTWPERRSATLDVYAPDPGLEGLLKGVARALMGE